MVHQELWSFSEGTFRSIFENINELRKSRKLCDVILKVDNEEYYAHRGETNFISTWLEAFKAFTIVLLVLL